MFFGNRRQSGAVKTIVKKVFAALQTVANWKYPEVDLERSLNYGGVWVTTT